MGKNIVKETKSELKKVIWPTKQQVINSTGVVIAMVLIMGVIIFAFDLGSGAAIKAIMGNTTISEEVHDHDHDHDEEIDETVETDAENNTPVEADTTGEANQ